MAQTIPQTMQFSKSNCTFSKRSVCIKTSKSEFKVPLSRTRIVGGYLSISLKYYRSLQTRIRNAADKELKLT